MTKFIVIAVVIALAFFIVQRSQNNKKAAQANIEQGRAFLAANMTKEGVITTESGLQYKVLEASESTEQPQHNSRVTVHYHGTLTDGSVFDSSVERGQSIEFALHQVIPGWTEGLQLMHKGEKTRLFIPSELGYGMRSAGAIPPGSVLIFDVELIDIH